jgi:SAM-dependent methyltransferase
VEEQRYTGVDNLEVLDSARNYNRFLTDRIVAESAGSSFAIDFGAGTGTIAAAVAARGIDVLCIEADAGLRQRLAARGLQSRRDLAEVDLECCAFIYSINVLEHIEDDAAALAALGARLQHGGRVLLYVPAFQVLYSSMDRKIGHWRRYSRGRLRDIARQAGLEVDTIRYADSLGFAASLAYKLFGSRKGDLSRGAVGIFDRVVFPCSLVLDRLGCSHLFGKNIWAVLRRP